MDWLPGANTLAYLASSLMKRSLLRMPPGVTFLRHDPARVASRVAFDEHDEDWVLAVVVDSVHHLQVGEVLLLELKS